MRIVCTIPLPEKDWLCSSVVRLAKVAQSNADEPTALLRSKINPLAQLQGDIHQFFAGGAW
jgi:hypothetical protein